MTPIVFDPSLVIGFFNGLTETGLEFGAEITIRYRDAHQEIPMLGQFVLVELSRPEEAVLGRIVAIRSSGKLASSPGDELGLKTVAHGTPLAEDIKEQFLRYKVSLRLLGVIRLDHISGRLNIIPSSRRLPHLGAKVSFPSPAILKVISGAERGGEPIGYLAFGEFVYCLGDSLSANISDDFIKLDPVIRPEFHVADLVRRRTQIFARAGYGKSNLIKLLFASLYKNRTPTIRLDDGNDHPVGSLIFDPDGEYFWPGPQVDSPPGLCDLEELSERLVVFTDRRSQYDYYNSFVIGTPRVDIRKIQPSKVVSVALPEARQGQQGTEAIRRMRTGQNWDELVDRTFSAIHQQRYDLIDDAEISRLTNTSQAAQIPAIRNSMLIMVRDLHDPNSAALDQVLMALRQGCIVVIDLSRMRGRPGRALNALLLQEIFDNNLNSHTDGDLIPCISIIEEAQTVLSSSTSSDAHPVFVEWTKEGRKYGLGSVIVTQQPGVIDMEILSQSDTTFAFHVVSKADLRALQNANAQFSDDILSCLLNEPIEGQGYFWTSASKPKISYPVSFRAFDFGTLYSRKSVENLRQTPSTFAQELKQDLRGAGSPDPSAYEPDDNDLIARDYSQPDGPAIAAATTHRGRITSYLQRSLTSRKPVFVLLQDLEKEFPDFIGSRKDVKKKRMWAAIELVFGQRGTGWDLQVLTSNSSGRKYVAIVRTNSTPT